MPLPQPVIDFISSLEILGTSQHANAGDTIAPRLDPDPARLDAFAVDELLARLDLSVVLDRVALQLQGAQGGPPPGATALDVVLKAVEFPPPADTQAADVDTTEAATRALPHLIPQPSAGVPPYVPPDDGIVARAGAWFNKRTVSLVEVPFAHELRQLGDGWRLEATSAGRLTVHMADGAQQKFDVKAGDQLSTAGDEMYLFLAAG